MTPLLRGARANFLRHKPIGWAGCADDGAYGCRDLGAANRDPLVVMAHYSKMSSASGAVEFNLCDVVTHFCHRTDLGMAASDVANGFSLDTIFLYGEE